MTSTVIFTVPPGVTVEGEASALVVQPPDVRVAAPAAPALQASENDGTRTSRLSKIRATG